METHQNGRNLLKISAKPLFETTKEWRDGKAKRMVQSIGQSGIFYRTVLKCLKQDYGNQTVLSYLKLKELFD